MVAGGGAGWFVGCAWCGDCLITWVGWGRGGAAVGVLLGAVAVVLGQGVVSFRRGVYCVYVLRLSCSEVILGYLRGCLPGVYLP